MNCKTCKHFGGASAQNSGFGDCTRIMAKAELNVKYKNDRFEYYNLDGSTFDDPAMTKDKEDYFSVLRVKENFGCVLWEAK